MALRGGRPRWVLGKTLQSCRKRHPASRLIHLPKRSPPRGRQWRLATQPKNRQWWVPHSRAQIAQWATPSNLHPNSTSPRTATPRWLIPQRPGPWADGPQRREGVRRPQPYPRSKWNIGAVGKRFGGMPPSTPFRPRLRQGEHNSLRFPSSALPVAQTTLDNGLPIQIGTRSQTGRCLPLVTLWQHPIYLSLPRGLHLASRAV
jgi:hypothetical protein